MFSRFWGSEFVATNFVILAIYGGVTALAYSVGVVFQGQVNSSEKKRRVGWLVASSVHIGMSVTAMVWLTIRTAGTDLDTWDWNSGLIWWHAVPVLLLGVVALEGFFGVLPAVDFFYRQKLDREAKHDPLDELFMKMEFWANQVEQNEKKHE